MNFVALVVLYFSFFSALCQSRPTDINEILKSGNGHSIKTAYKVMTIEQEYKLLRYLKLKPLFQKLIIIDGYFFDAITTNSKIIYFKLITKQLPNKTSQQVI